jgi:hypothetical protein
MERFSFYLFVAHLWRVLCGTCVRIWIDVKKQIICSNVFLQISVEAVLFFVALRPNAGHSLLLLEVLDYTQQHTTVGRTPLCECLTLRRNLWQNITLTADKHPCLRGIRTHDLSRQADADPRLIPRGQWDRLKKKICQHIFWGRGCRGSFRS